MRLAARMALRLQRVRSVGMPDIFLRRCIRRKATGRGAGSVCWTVAMTNSSSVDHSRCNFFRFCPSVRCMVDLHLLFYFRLIRSHFSCTFGVPLPHV
jgi:hypothetical protein